MSAIGTLEQKTKRTVEKANPAIQIAERIGYSAKGVIYFLIGLLAFLAASGYGDGQTPDQKGVIRRLAEQPFGSVIVLILAVGLFSYSAFRLVSAVWNPEHNKPLKRIANAIAGLGYGGFGLLAVTACFGARIDNDQPKKAAEVMRFAFGDWLVIGVGVVIACVGIAQIVNGFAGRFLKSLKLDEMSKDEKELARVIGTIGLIAIGIVFLITGCFLVGAGWEHDPKKADGLDLALAAIGHAKYGRVWLGATGIGVVLYGVYMFVEARFRKFEPI